MQFAIHDHVWIVGGPFAGKSGEVIAHKDGFYAVRIYGTQEITNCRPSYMELIG